MAFTKSLGGKSLHYGVRRRKVMRSMSQTGLGRVEMPDRVGIEGGRWCGVRLCPDRGDKRPDAHDVHDAGEIVGEYV